MRLFLASFYLPFSQICDYLAYKVIHVALSLSLQNSLRKEDTHLSQLSFKPVYSTLANRVSL